MKQSLLKIALSTRPADNALHAKLNAKMIMRIGGINGTDMAPTVDVSRDASLDANLRRRRSSRREYVMLLWTLNSMFRSSLAIRPTMRTVIALSSRTALTRPSLFLPVVPKFLPSLPVVPNATTPAKTSDNFISPSATYLPRLLPSKTTSICSSVSIKLSLMPSVESAEVPPT